MKKIRLIIICLISFGLAQAQTEQGSWTLGATSDLSFTSTSFDGVDDNVNSFNLSIGAGYFVIDHLAAGLNLRVASSSQGDFSSNLFAVGPFARYYANGTFFLGASFLISNGTSDNGVEELNTNATILGFEAGYPIWIVDNVAIEPALVYEIQSSDDIGDANRFGLNVGFRLYF